MLIAAATALVMLLILIFFIRQITQPVRRLAQGMRLLAADLRAPDLPMRGPRELQELAAACNEMKRQIRELLDDCTRILAAIAHDVRTYLTRLRLRTDFIDDRDQRKRAVGDLDEMSRLLEDTLTFAREATGAFYFDDHFVVFTTIDTQRGELIRCNGANCHVEIL